MPQSKAALRYAKALFLLASEQGRLDPLQADLQALRGLMSGSHELCRFLDNHLLDPARRAQVLGEIFERQGHAEPLLVRFLFLLENKNRMTLLADVIDAFGELHDRERGILRVRVTSASPLETSQAQRIVERLHEQYAKEIRPEFLVDTALLGGFIVQVGDLVRDLSIETQLQRLQRQLAEG
jgi:F-type H+-transporting ATPase subunit delta